MKKVGLILLGFIIGAILTYKFCPRPIDGPHAVDTKYKVPKDTISVAQAKLLSNNWAKNNDTEVDPLLDVEGSRKKVRSVWWSLKEVNEYLAYAQEKSDSLGYKMTGIRVYLGNYGKNGKLGKKNRNTMFIVPTGPKSTSKASTLNMLLPPSNRDIPLPPLNKGTGGQGGYPE